MNWDAAQYFNFFEGILWFIIGFIIFRKSRDKRYLPIQKTLFVLSLFFYLFGVSDFIEMSTGAWWRPWWLLLMKVSCGVAFTVLFRVWYVFEKSKMPAIKSNRILAVAGFAVIVLLLFFMNMGAVINWFEGLR